MKIAILCPSRARPQRFREMVESARGKALSPERVHVHLALDRDDPKFGEYLAELPAGVTVHVNEEPRSVPALLEWLSREARGDVLYIGADDIVFRTEGWDGALRQVFAFPGPRAAATNDGSGITKWTHFAVNREWLEVLGHLTPEFEHFGTDEYVERIAKGAGRGTYLAHVLIEHMHKKYRYADGRPKSENDATYEAKRQKAEDGSSMSTRDQARMREYLPLIREAVARLQAC